MTQDSNTAPAVDTATDAGNAASEAQRAAKAARDEIKVESSQQTNAAPAPAKVETEANDAPDGDGPQNESEESAGSESGDAPAQQPRKKKPGVHERIDELTKLRYDAERERDHWREMALRNQQPQQPPAESQPAQAVPAASDEPTLESCDFDVTEFNRKWYEWRRNEDRKQEAAQQRQAKFVEKVTAFRADHPDFDQVVGNPALPLTQQVLDVVIDSDEPAAIAYYLGNNPQEAAAIAQMTPAQIGRAIGRIEAKLSAPLAAPAAARQPEPKTVTRAPPPVTTLSGAAPSVRKSYADMTQAEYEAARREERRAKGLEP